ncbi:MAG: hypothetical protein JSV80_07195 [Acidobacteriota bacterium]|nr:MAG: hypothetical protein JSV80_07195 [Acidobacteriota bacterium]
MRPAAVFKWSVALAVAVVALVASPALAQIGPCEQACIDQWEIDVANCEDQLASALADIQAELDDCLANATNIIEQGLCIRTSNIQRANAEADFNACLSLANTIAYNCIRDCQMSPSAP